MAFGKPKPTNKSAGRRADLYYMYFRSKWEANYARYLNLLACEGKITKWEFEPDTFWFDKIKRGTNNYLPDFKVFYPDGRVEYHETKGYLDAKSKTKLKRMAKYHPTVNVVLIHERLFRYIDKTYGSTTPHWEELRKRGGKRQNNRTEPTDDREGSAVRNKRGSGSKKKTTKTTETT